MFQCFQYQNYWCYLYESNKNIREAAKIKTNFIFNLLREHIQIVVGFKFIPSAGSLLYWSEYMTGIAYLCGLSEKKKSHLYIPVFTQVFVHYNKSRENASYHWDWHTGDEIRLNCFLFSFSPKDKDPRDLVGCAVPSLTFYIASDHYRNLC